MENFFETVEQFRRHSTFHGEKFNGWDRRAIVRSGRVDLHTDAGVLTISKRFADMASVRLDDIVGGLIKEDLVVMNKTTMGGGAGTQYLLGVPAALVSPLLASDKLPRA